MADSDVTTALYDVTTLNVTNATESPPLNEALYITYNVMLISITILIMFSMGTGITVGYLKIILTRPIGPIIGFICQCILMPLMCFGYAIILNLDDNIAFGMILTGCCPGGTVSNIITFWSKADIVLSVCMTTISTTLAILFLPLNMFIYSRYWVEDMTQIPYVNMVVTVLYLWAAVLIGYAVGWKWPKSTPYFTKIGSAFSLVLILAAGVVQGQLYPDLFNVTWQTYVAATTMPVIGFVIGFGIALIFCLRSKQRLAVGFETGIQNTALGLTIIAITYPSSYEASYYSQFIILYTTFQVVLGIGTVVCIWIYNFIRYREFPWTKKDSFPLVKDSGEKTLEMGVGQRARVTVDESSGAQLVYIKEEENESFDDKLEEGGVIRKDSVTSSTSSDKNSQRYGDKKRSVERHASNTSSQHNLAVKRVSSHNSQRSSTSSNN